MQLSYTVSSQIRILISSISSRRSRQKHLTFGGRSSHSWTSITRCLVRFVIILHLWNVTLFNISVGCLDRASVKSCKTKSTIRKVERTSAESKKKLTVWKPMIMMSTYNKFFSRVLHTAAITVSEMCEVMCIEEGVVEMIWSVMKVLLGQETEMLMGRHIDQLVMATIYGVCRVHPSCFKPGSQQHMNSKQVLFNDIIEAYKEINKSKISSVGRKLPGM